MKMVRLSYPTFEALVCFTGLAKTSISSGEDTTDEIVKWLSDSKDARLFQVVERIRAGATDYISTAEQVSKRRERLTIVVAAFMHERIQVAIISNFQNTLGQVSHEPLPELEVSWASLRPGDAPMVLVTGNAQAVSKQDLDSLLREITEAGEDSARVRAAIRDLSRRASRHPAANETISEGCTVASMDSSGSGMQDIDGTRGIEFKHVHNGFHFSFREVLKQLGLQNAELAGASFGTTKPTTRKPPTCARELWDVSNSGFSMIEILHTVDLDCAPLGLSGENVVLGSHSDPSDRSRHIYWTWKPENPDQIDPLDIEPTQVHGGCMNAQGAIAVLHGVSEDPEGTVFGINGGTYRLEIPEGMGEPSLAAMNARGEICGSLSITLDNTATERTRPAFWDVNGRAHVLSDLAVGTSGRAVDLGDDGVIFVWESYGVFGRAATLWNPVTGSLSHVPGEIIATAQAESGVLLGFDRQAGRDVAVVSVDRQSWSDLPLNNGFAPADLNSAITIVGNVRADGFNSGWLLRSGAHHPLLLPTFRYHNTHPRHINSGECITGSLSADNEQHVVLWTPIVSAAGTAHSG